jgi:hypothetical protein
LSYTTLDFFVDIAVEHVQALGSKVRSLSFHMHELVVTYHTSQQTNLKMNTKETGIVIYSREKVDLAASLITALMTLALLVIPIYLYGGSQSLKTID